MSKPAVSVQGLWKEYRVGGQRAAGETFYDVLSGALRRPFRRGAAGGDGADGPDAAGSPGDGAPDRFWALRDVSFDIAPGDVVGIIGRNGAGKSTLLKILSRITAPTKGRIEVRGRLASLLEVGTGFHAELSGRENIYLNGAILGMTRRDIARKFDEIVAFAEVEKFIDTPVKRYSSGMYVRLAFAVAAHLDADVLVVDEVLAVGDAQFQKRCMQKMSDVAAGGRTVLFVSHNMNAVQRLCSRAIWLVEGRLMDSGPVDALVATYLQDGMTSPATRVWPDLDRAPGGDDVRLVRASVSPLLGEPGQVVTVATGSQVEFEYVTLRDDLHLNLSVHLFTSDDQLVLNAVPLNEPMWFGKPFPKGRYRCRFDLPPHLLNVGRYRVELLFVRDQSVILHKEPSALAIEVEDSPSNSLWHGRFPGVVRPNLHWTTEKLS